MCALQARFQTMGLELCLPWSILHSTTTRSQARSRPAGLRQVATALLLLEGTIAFMLYIYYICLAAASRQHGRDCMHVRAPSRHEIHQMPESVASHGQGLACIWSTACIKYTRQ